MRLVRCCGSGGAGGPVAQREGLQRLLPCCAAFRELILGAVLVPVSRKRMRGRSSPSRLPEVLLAGEKKEYL